MMTMTNTNDDIDIDIDFMLKDGRRSTICYLMSGRKQYRH